MLQARRARALTVSCLFAAQVAAACGGRAHTRDGEDPAEAEAEAECVDGCEPLPPTFEVLELRLMPLPPIEAQRGACGFRGRYTTRLKINMRHQLLIAERCEFQSDGIYSSGTTNTELAPSELQRVQEAYELLAPATTEQCASKPEVISLDLEPEDGPDLLFADEEHSSCPLEALEGARFVSGLNELYADLLSLGLRAR
jgi:hypothetical protein